MRPAVGAVQIFAALAPPASQQQCHELAPPSVPAVLRISARRRPRAASDVLIQSGMAALIPPRLGLAAMAARHACPRLYEILLDDDDDDEMMT